MDINQREREQEQQSTNRSVCQEAGFYHTRRGADGKPRCWPLHLLHKAVECTRVTHVADRKQILLNKRLCFNCTTRNHRVAFCPSKSVCQQFAGNKTKKGLGPNVDHKACMD